jgi:hypothetical protein
MLNSTPSEFRSINTSCIKFKILTRCSIQWSYGFFLITLKKLPSLNNGKPTRYNWLIKMGPYMNNYTEKNFKPKYFKTTLILF